MKVFVKSAVKKFPLKNGLHFAKLLISLEEYFQGDQGNGMSFAKIQVYVTGGENVYC